MAEEPHNEPHFHGSFTYGVDRSRRVMVPADWRPEDAKFIFTAILWPINVESFLLVLPPARWQVMLDKLKTRSLQDEGVATFERVIGATSAKLRLDRVGRFCLPEDLATAVGIESHAQFVGRLDKFEIWSPTRFKAGVAQDKKVAATVASEINL